MMLDHPHDVDELVKTNVELMSNVAIVIECVGAVRPASDYPGSDWVWPAIEHQDKSTSYKWLSSLLTKKNL